MFRAVAIEGACRSVGYALLVAVSYAVFILGYKFFIRYKSVIVDVI